MKKLLPIFRAGTYPQATSIAKDGKVTAAHIADIAKNTSRVLKETSFRPPVKFGHVKDGDAAGWAESVEARGDVLFAELDFNELGAAAVKGKRRRFVSSEIVPSFSLTGDDTGEKVGITLKGVALLGAEAPQIKTLCDLAECEFSESEEGTRIVREMTTLTDHVDGGAIAYFAEIEFNDEEKDKMSDAQFKELETKLEAEKRRADEAEAKFAEVKMKERQTENAAFAESLVTEKKLGADGAKNLRELLDSIDDESTAGKVKAFAKAIPAIGSNFSEKKDEKETGDVTAAKISAVVAKRRAADPKFTEMDLLREVSGAAN